MRVLSDLFDFSIHFISYLFISLIFLLFLLPYTFYFLDVYEPHDHFITEAYVEYTQESFDRATVP